MVATVFVSCCDQFGLFLSYCAEGVRWCVVNPSAASGHSALASPLSTVWLWCRSHGPWGISQIWSGEAVANLPSVPSDCLLKRLAGVGSLYGAGGGKKKKRKCKHADCVVCKIAQMNSAKLILVLSPKYAINTSVKEIWFNLEKTLHILTSFSKRKATFHH